MDLVKYVNKELIEGKMYQLIDKLNEIKINHTGFYSILFNKAGKKK